MASRSSWQKLNWQDPFALEQQLTDEQRMVRDTARQYAQDKLLPRVKEAFRTEHTDPAIYPEMGKLGLLVCWDQCYPEAARLMALAGADMLIYPTAIGWNPADDEAEKQRQLGAWQIIQRGHAVANGLPVIVPNRTGTELSPDGEKIEFWGNSFVAGPQGEILAAAPADEPTTLLVDVDLRRSEEVRRIWPFLRDRRVDAYPNIVRRFID